MLSSQNIVGGKVLMAIITLSIRAGKEEEVLNQLRNRNYIMDLSMVYGVFDIIAKVKATDVNDLKSIKEDLEKISGITVKNLMIVREVLES